MKQVKSSLLKTSSANDVKVVGGEVSITGLPTFRENNIKKIVQLIAKDEVVQVVTGANDSYTPTASTKYAVVLHSAAYARTGNDMLTEKVYSYTTPPVITTLGANAALQREAIHAILVAAINLDAANNVVAASLTGGAGITITDDPGYFPGRLNGTNNGRKGATQVYGRPNTDGTGFTSTQFAVTTAAVYGFGIGSRMDDDAPVMSNMTGNLISGELDAPAAADGSFAVAGQKYNAFYIEVNMPHDIPTIVPHVKGNASVGMIVFVDNGLGTATTNAAGYLTFQRAMLRLLFKTFKNDPKAIYSFFDVAPTFSTLTGLSVIPTTALAENAANLGDGMVIAFTPSVVATAAANAMPIIDSTNGGLNLANDAASAKGLEISAPLSAFSGKEFIVGQDEFSLYVRAFIDDVSGVNPFLVGFRKKAAYAAAASSYTDYVGIGLVGGAGAIKTQSIVGSVASTPVDTAKTWADAATHELEVRVNKAGVATYFVDGVLVAPPATLNTLTAGTVMIPFTSELQTADVAANVSIREWAALPTKNWRS